MSEETKQVWDNLFQKLNEKEKTFLAVVNNEKNKEIERLNNKNEELLTLYTTEREVKDYYKNIINELEKWLYDRSELTNFGAVIDKIKEIKGSDKNE